MEDVQRFSQSVHMTWGSPGQGPQCRELTARKGGRGRAGCRGTGQAAGPCTGWAKMTLLTILLRTSHAKYPFVRKVQERQSRLFLCSFKESVHMASIT